MKADQSLMKLNSTHYYHPFLFTSEKATTCGGGLKVAKLVVAFSSTLHPYGVLLHIPPALLVVCGFIRERPGAERM
jgi:hypothetical protein